MGSVFEVHLRLPLTDIVIGYNCILFTIYTAEPFLLIGARPHCVKESDH